MRPLRILTWQVHGSYLYYLSQLPHQFYVMRKPHQPPGYRGRCARWPWGDNVHDMPVEQARSAEFDCILFQQESHYLVDQYLFLNAAQRRLPRIFLEHEIPPGHPTNSRHTVDDPEVLLVHVSAFHALMWDNGRQTTRVIDYGALTPPEVQYSGERPCGLSIVNHLGRDERQRGGDIYRHIGQHVPLELIGAESEAYGGAGLIAHASLPAFAAQYRFLFQPGRYARLGLAVIEAMLIGMPVIGLATAEMASVVQNGISGYVDTDLGKLQAHMQELLADPHYAFVLGRGAQRRARERFGMRRFIADWNSALHLVTNTAHSRKEPACLSPNALP